MMENKKTIISLIIEGLILLVLLSIVWGVYDKKLDKSEQNLLAATSELNEIKLKNGELLYERDSYILKEQELTTALNISKKEISEIKKKLNSSLAYIATLENRTKIDSIVIIRDSIIYKNPDYVHSQFYYKDKWVEIIGDNGIRMADNIVKEITTNLTKIDILTPLVIGITDDYNFFVKSDNPYLTFSKIEGVAIENSKFVPRKKRVNFGVQLGFGFNYGIINKSLDIGPYMGAGIEWNF